MGSYSSAYDITQLLEKFKRILGTIDDILGGQRMGAQSTSNDNLPLYA